MNRTRLVRGAAAGGLTALLSIAGATASGFAATASPSPSASPQPALTLAQVKAHCNDAVQRRLGTLGADNSFVTQSIALSSADRQTLQGQIAADQSGLTQLDQTIQQDPTIQQARADCAKIVTNYRVYLLEDPKIHEVIAADGITKVNAAFETLIPQLQGLINNSSQPPSVKQQAQNTLNDLRSKVSASETSISGVTASVINLQPLGYPGNAVVLKSAAQNIETSRDDLNGARADVTTILHLLGQQ